MLGSIFKLSRLESFVPEFPIIQISNPVISVVPVLSIIKFKYPFPLLEVRQTSELPVDLIVNLTDLQLEGSESNSILNPQLITTEARVTANTTKIIVAINGDTPFLPIKAIFICFL